MKINNLKKFNKIRKGKLKYYSFKLNKLQFGTIGLKALQSGIITYKQINTIKQTITIKTKHQTKIWIKKLYLINITKKSTGIKMGKGYGKIIHSAFKVNCGNIFLEFYCFNNKNLIHTLNSCKFKLSIKTKIIKDKLLNN